MIGADTTFLVQLELIELSAHKAARELLYRNVLQSQTPLALAPQVLSEFLSNFRLPFTDAVALSEGEW